MSLFIPGLFKKNSSTGKVTIFIKLTLSLLIYFFICVTYIINIIKNINEKNELIWNRVFNIILKS